MIFYHHVPGRIYCAFVLEDKLPDTIVFREIFARKDNENKTKVRRIERRRRMSRLFWIFFEGRGKNGAAIDE